MRPTVWRCSIASSAAGSSSNGTSSPTTGRTAPRRDELEDLRVELLGVGAGQEVRADGLLHREWIVHVGQAHPDQREVPEDDRARHQSLVFGLDPGREPGEHVPSAEGHAFERARRRRRRRRCRRPRRPRGLLSPRARRPRSRWRRCRSRRRRRVARRSGPSRRSRRARSRARRRVGPTAPRRSPRLLRRRGSAPSRPVRCRARRCSASEARWNGIRTAAASGSGMPSGIGKVMVAGATANSA